MIYEILLALSTSDQCSNSTIDLAAQSTLYALRARDFNCLRSLMLHPSEKFDGNNINVAVLQNLEWRQNGHRSYLDIADDGVRIDIAGSGKSRSIYYIDKRKFSVYIKNKQSFKFSGYKKWYFTCNIVESQGKWWLSDDLCFTEMD